MRINGDRLAHVTPKVGGSVREVHKSLGDSVRRGEVRSVLFDFDGTLSLIRQGWQDVMVPMMVDILAELESGETRVLTLVEKHGMAMLLRGELSMLCSWIAAVPTPDAPPCMSRVSEDFRPASRKMLR